MRRLVWGLAAMLWAGPAFAQVDGNVTVMFDILPDLAASPGAQRAAELRTRVYAERADAFGEHIRTSLSAYFDALAAERPAGDPQSREGDAIVRPGDIYLDYRAERFDLRAGFARIVWGRLDEFQPTDVVNPIDLTRFVFDGRSEARLPVALVRGRLFLPHSSTLEAVLVPVFRAGRFDQLDEPSSPFNLIAPFPIAATEPHRLQGGARFTTTSGRVDWGVSAYHGFHTFPTPGYMPFTMAGGDFETVRGAWGVRGEGSWFSNAGEDEFEAGAGVDRRAGDYRVAGNVLVTRHQLEGTQMLAVGAIDRSFARDTRRLRFFGAYDPIDDTAFVRGILAVSLRDDVWIEGSGGLFAGSSSGTIGRLTRRDFVYARLKVFF